MVIGSGGFYRHCLVCPGTGARRVGHRGAVLVGAAGERRLRRGGGRPAGTAVGGHFVHHRAAGFLAAQAQVEGVVASDAVAQRAGVDQVAEGQGRRWRRGVQYVGDGRALAAQSTCRAGLTYHIKTPARRLGPSF